jgi:AcrR family transcriptional regulator
LPREFTIKHQADTRQRAAVERDRHGRGGRPPLSRAADVDERILDAAKRLFLEQGFEATSCEHVAALARAGKASLYARFPNKEALFAAVIRRTVDRALAPAGDVDATLPLRERLIVVGISLLEHSLQPDAVALMRAIIAVAPRMPELAHDVDRIGWEVGVGRVAEALSARRHGDVAIRDAWPAAARFIELVFVPHLMRALVGDSTATLIAGARQQIEIAIDTLQATRSLDAWE